MYKVSITMNVNCKHFADVDNKLKVFLSTVFGGVSVVDSIGCWWNNDTACMIDDTNKIYTSNVMSMHYMDEYYTKMIDHVLSEVYPLSEEICLFYEIDGIGYLYTGGSIID